MCRGVTGHLKEEDSKVAQMVVPVKPILVLLPSKKHMSALIETARQIVKDKDRADFLAKRQEKSAARAEADEAEAG